MTSVQDLQDRIKKLEEDIKKAQEEREQTEAKIHCLERAGSTQGLERLERKSDLLLEQMNLLQGQMNLLQSRVATANSEVAAARALQLERANSTARPADAMDVDTEPVTQQQVKQASSKLLQAIKALVVFPENPSISKVFKAQESMELLPSVNHLVDIDFHRLDGVPQLLFSTNIFDAMVSNRVIMPYQELLDNKARMTALIGVSGCGKTRTCFDIARNRWVLYFDCKVDDDVVQLYSALGSIPHSSALQVTFEEKSRHLIHCLFLARLIVLGYLKDIKAAQGLQLTPLDWISYQRSRRTRKVFLAIFEKLAESAEPITTSLRADYDKMLKDMTLIFDESQCLLKVCPVSYKGSQDDPRSLLSFMAQCVLRYQTIWCGTQMRIRNISLLDSVAAGKPEAMVNVHIFTNFNYLKPDVIQAVLCKFVKISWSNHKDLLEEMCIYLQGRPRFVTQFLVELANRQDRSSDRASIVRAAFESYRKSLVDFGSSQTDRSLCGFWLKRYDQVIECVDPKANDTSPKIVCDVLLHACMESMFARKQGRVYFTPMDADMVSTALVMIHKPDKPDNVDKDIGWYCTMTEPMAIQAGLNFFASKKPEVIMNYFASKLFVPLGDALSLPPSSRGYLMELAIAVRFLQGWWRKDEFKEFRRMVGLHTTDLTKLPPVPSGLIDLRHATAKDDLEFLKYLKDPKYDKVILPSTSAGPDIACSDFTCHVKTAKKQVSSTDCKANEATTDTMNWYDNPITLEMKNRVMNELQAIQRTFIHMRFELPYTAPRSRPMFIEKDENDNWVVLVDLKEPFTKLFFGESFVNQYLAYVETHGVEQEAADD